MKLPTDQETEAVLPALGPTQFLKNWLRTTQVSEETQSTAGCPGDWWPDAENATTWEMRTVSALSSLRQGDCPEFETNWGGIVSSGLVGLQSEPLSLQRKGCVCTGRYLRHTK